ATRVAIEQGRVTAGELDPWSAAPTVDVVIGGAQIGARSTEDGAVFWIKDRERLVSGPKVPVATSLTVGGAGDEIGDFDARIELVTGTIAFPDLDDIARILRDRGFKEIDPVSRLLVEHHGLQEATVG